MSGAGPVLVPGEPPRIGRFRIAAQIGTGSATHVYLAMDTREGVWRALKVLAFDKMGAERARSRFRRECEAALKVSHPHLLTAFDAGEDPYAPWLALEVCEGGSLLDWVERRGPMPAFLAIEVMVQVCSGLAAAHRVCIAQKRVDARDILLNRQGRCQLTDFRAVSGGSSGLGSDSIDLRDDVVGAGGVLHFLVTGRPWAEGQPMVGVPDALQAIVVRAIQRGRGQGYPDAAAMARDLEAAMLEVSLPNGPMPSLVERDATLPEAVEDLFDPDHVFEDLERAARWAAQPEAGPAKVAHGGDLMKMLTSPSAPRAEGSAPRATLGYTMPTQASVPGASRRFASPPESRPEPRSPEERDALAAAPFQRVTPAPAHYHTSPHGRITPGGMPGLPANVRTVTPAPVAKSEPRGRPAPQELKPDYIVDEPDQLRDESWRRTTPQPAQRVQGPPADKLDPRLGLLAVVLLFLCAIGVFAKGAYDVKQARLLADAAGENLTAIVEAQGAAVNDLATRGADRKRLEDSFFAYKEAGGASRYRAADAFAAALLEEAASVGVDPAAPVKDAATQRVSAIGEARARYLRERQTWAETAGGFPGVLPVLIGVASSPE